jgi:ADP-ribose pyrophosphatase YjhB (NUDIX family)
MSIIESKKKFSNTRLRALFGSIYAKLTQKEDQLVSLQEVLTLTKASKEKHLRTQTIPIDNIIGSEARYIDFNKEFLPKKEYLGERWATIDHMMEKQVKLPPISVYKIDDYYFVRDGNHRVSVAKNRGQIFIDADVTEYMISVSLTKEMTTEDKLMIQEHANFLDITHLDHLDPGSDIKLTIPESYQNLLHIIQHFEKSQLEKKKKPLNLIEASKNWYETIFLPFAEEAYLDDILNPFPNRTTGDLYVWMQMNWAVIRDKIGEGMFFLEGGTPQEFQKPGKLAKSEAKHLGKKLPSITHAKENRFLNAYIGIVVTGVLLYIQPGGEIKIATVKRKYHPFEGFWSLPIAMLGASETRFDCAERCFARALGVQRQLKLAHFQTFDGVDRQPFGRAIAFGIMAIYYGENMRLLAGGIASETSLIDLDDVPQLVYDHNQILKGAYEYLYRIRNNFSLIRKLFPDEMPLKYICDVFEKIRSINHTIQNKI